MPLGQLICMTFLATLATSVLAALILCYAFGSGLNRGISVAGFGCGALLALFVLARARPLDVRSFRLSGWGKIVLVSSALILFRLFGWVVWADGDAVMVNNPHNYGDAPLHITYMKYLARGATWWPDNPILSGTKASYPLGMDALGAMLAVVGVDTIWGLRIVGILCSLAALFALMSWGGPFAVSAFMFNGGLFALAYAGIDPPGSPGWDVFWKNIPLTLFSTQRGFLFAVPAGLMLLHSWRERLLRRRGPGMPLPLWSEVVFYASMPLFHMHTFVFLSMLLGIWFVMRPRARGRIFVLVLLSFLPASLIVMEMTDRFSGLGITRFGWIWAGRDWIYWIWNFGILIALVPLAVLLAVCNRRADVDRALLVPGVVLFALFSVLIMQPLEWDNMKLFVWSYLLVAPALYSLVIGKLSMLPRVSLYAVLFLSGACELWMICRPGSPGLEIYRASEVSAVENALRSLPPHVRVAVHPTFNHPVSLAGHPVALGYQGHIWTHGFDYVGIERKLTRLMKGDPGWCELARGIGVQYVFWGERERTGYKRYSRRWGEREPFAEGSWGKLFRCD